MEAVMKEDLEDLEDVMDRLGGCLEKSNAERLRCSEEGCPRCTAFFDTGVDDGFLFPDWYVEKHYGKLEENGMAAVEGHKAHTLDAHDPAIAQEGVLIPPPVPPPPPPVPTIDLEADSPIREVGATSSAPAEPSHQGASTSERSEPQASTSLIREVGATGDKHTSSAPARARPPCHAQSGH